MRGLAVAVAVAACHVPGVTFTPAGDVIDAGDSSETTPAACGDGIDNDGDGLVDCADPDCWGIGTCPICGTIEHLIPGGQLLPDGVGTMQCLVPGGQDVCPIGQLCFATPNSPAGAECRTPYTTSLHASGFSPGQTLTSVSNLRSVCVTIEHSWMRDLEIDLVSPSGQVIQLDQFMGQQGGEVYLGDANDCDEAAPVPGVGAAYCWTPTASSPSMIQVANSGPFDTVRTCMGASANELPPGNYAAAAAWSQLVGATLNGDWTLRVADLWAIDNGFLFQWSLSFDPSIVQSCAGSGPQ